MRAIRFLAAAVLMASASTAFATAQIADQIVLDGVPSPLHSEPLRFLLDQPEEKRTIKLKVAGDDCSASWRGYVASWRIEDDRLLLEKVVTDPCGDATEVPVESIFSGQTAPISASWFTGVLIVPRGEMVEYVHMGYQSVYERYVILVLKKGQVVFRTEVDEPPQ